MIKYDSDKQTSLEIRWSKDMKGTANSEGNVPAAWQHIQLSKTVITHWNHVINSGASSCKASSSNEFWKIGHLAPYMCPKARQLVKWKQNANEIKQ